MLRAPSNKPTPIDKRCFNFAVEIVRYSDVLISERRYEISRQIIRSGTSVGANLREATNAVSTADFLNKLAISQKEISETIFWLELMDTIRTGNSEKPLLNEAEQIYKILKTISLNTKRNLAKIKNGNTN